MRRVSLAARRARTFLRRPPPPRWRRPVLIGLGAAIGLTIIALGAQYAVRSGLVASATGRVERGLLAWSAQAGLVIDEIRVDGRVRTSSAAVLGHLGVHRGQPILSVATTDLRARLEDLTWVERAEVVRLLPDGLHVRLHERRPLALWQRQGRLRLIDHAGRTIALGRERHDLLRTFGDLRILIGEGAPERASRMFAALSSEPALWSQVTALTLVGERRWNLRLEGGIDVMLPAEDPLGAWHRLAALAREEALLERAVVTIDLRFLPERIRLRLDPDLRDRGNVA